MGAYLALKSKNILPYPFSDKGIVTRNGITFTDNGDGSITVNGTATADSYFSLSYTEPFTEKYTYVACFTGNPAGASGSTYYIYLPQTGHKITTSYYLGGIPSFWRSLRIIVKSGVTANNVVFRPMLYVYDAAKGYDTNYEPYYTYKRVKAFGRMVRNPKNLIPYPYALTKPITSGGVTVTPQSDGGLHIKGKATATMSQNIYLKILNGATMEGGKQYTLYLKGLTKNAGHVYLHGIYSRNNGQSWGAFASTSSGNPKAFEFPTGDDIYDYRIQIVVLTYAGEIDEVVYPMLVEGSYTASTMPNYFVPTKCTLRMRPTTFPEQYQRVEYIESTGTQYIDTGVIGKSPMTAETKMRWLALSGDAGFLGARTDLNGTRRLYPFYQYPNATWNIGYKENRNTGATIVANTDYVLKSVLTRGKQEFYVNGVKVWSGTDDFEVNTGYPMRLFGYYKENENTTNYNAEARLYYLTIYDGDKLVRKFIPCYRKRDGKIGLLDIVSGVFYTNPQGTGEFIIEDYNKQYQSVEYIESTGTQYIDTGVMPKNSLSFQTRSNFSDGTFFGSQDSSNANKCIAIAGSGGLEYVRFLSGSGEAINDLILDSNTIYDLSVTSKKATLTYNNITYETNLTPTDTSSDFPIYIFARNTNNIASGYSTRKLYSFAIYNNGILIRDFIPCYRKSDGVVGLYDKVNKVFYTNKGTGTFNKGANV